MTEKNETADCARCSNEYDSDLYPCNKCADNPDIISHFTTQQPRLLNYFIGAPVMVKTGLTTRLMPYDGLVLAYLPENVRLPTLQEAAKRCPGIWLIPWPEMPEEIQYYRFLAWERETDRIVEYGKNNAFPSTQWPNIKAIQILPELKQ